MKRMGAALLAVALAGAGMWSVAAQARDLDEMNLFYAELNGQTAKVAQLLDKGVDIDAQDTGGFTLLMQTIINGHDDIARLLLDRGADLNIRNDEGQTASELAEIFHERKIAAMIAGAAADGAAAGSAPGAPRSAAARGAPAVRTAPAAPRQPAAPAQTTSRPGGSKTWPQLGAFAIGDQVRFTDNGGALWETGKIVAIDPKMGYLVEGRGGSQYYHHRYEVAGTQSEPFWTDWFVGDWRISIPVASNVVTDGTNLYRTYSGGMRLPPLKVNADGSYSWRIEQNGRETLIKGRWVANPDGPGIFLQKGEHGVDWLMYNNTDVGSKLGETVILANKKYTYYDGTRLK